jgi:hypothetical protein
MFGIQLLRITRRRVTCQLNCCNRDAYACMCAENLVFSELADHRPGCHLGGALRGDGRQDRPHISFEKLPAGWLNSGSVGGIDC